MTFTLTEPPHHRAASGRLRRAAAALLLTGLLAACSWAPPPQQAPSTGASAPIDIQARPNAASTGHPLATQAALQMLAEGGSAVDATIAAQMVLGLVEPQSSGIGGGALLLVWDGAQQRLRSYDGLAAAPGRVTASLRNDIDGRLLTVNDVLHYRAAERQPVCARVRVWQVCSLGPPSFGGLAVLQMLQLLDLRSGGSITAASLDDPAFWHLYAEAGRLAQADRRHWVGDPDQVAVPVATLLAPAYLRQRAALIDPARAAPTVRHGTPVPPPVSRVSDELGTVNAQTSQIVVADAKGMVVSTSTTINLNFGSRLRVDGYVLNNALTNFSPTPAGGQTLANQMASGKRAITSMAPVIVFDAQGRPLIAGGSAGGGQLVDYITRNLIEMLWLDASPAQALAGGHVTTALAPRLQLEAGSPRAALATALRERGHEVVVEPTPSGASFLRRVDGGWIGAADPRRDGLALGR